MFRSNANKSNSLDSAGIDEKNDSGISSVSKSVISNRTCCSCHDCSGSSKDMKITFHFGKGATFNDITSVTPIPSNMSLGNVQQCRGMPCRSIVVSFPNEDNMTTSIPTPVHQQYDTSNLHESLLQPHVDDLRQERSEMAFRAYCPCPQPLPSEIERKYEELKFPTLWKRLKDLEKEVQGKQPLQNEVSYKDKNFVETREMLRKTTDSKSVGVGDDIASSKRSDEIPQNDYFSSNELLARDSSATTAQLLGMSTSVSTQTEVPSLNSDFDNSDLASTKSASAADASTDTSDLNVVPSSTVLPKWVCRTPNYRNLVIRTKFRCPSVPNQVRHLLNANNTPESASSSITFHSDISQSTIISHSENNVIGCENVPECKAMDNANYIPQLNGCVQQTTENLLCTTSSYPESAHVQSFQRPVSIVKPCPNLPVIDDLSQPGPSNRIPEATCYPEIDLRSQPNPDFVSSYQINGENVHSPRSRPVVFYCSSSQREQIRLRESPRNPILIKLCRSCYCVLQDVTQNNTERSVAHSETHLSESLASGTGQRSPLHPQSERPHTANVILPTQEHSHTESTLFQAQVPCLPNPPNVVVQGSSKSSRKDHLEPSGLRPRNDDYFGENNAPDSATNRPVHNQRPDRVKSPFRERTSLRTNDAHEEGNSIFNEVKLASEFENSLSPEFVRACQLINDYLLNLNKDRDSSLKRVVVRVQEKWFEVAGSKTSNSRLVRKYLDYFHGFSSEMLKWIINRCDTEGNTVLNFALANNRYDVVRDLLQTGYCDLNKPNKVGNTPVIICASCRPEADTDIHTIRNILRVGNVHFRSRQHGQTALMTAVSYGNLKMTELLLEAGADANAQDDDGSTALMFAAEKGHVECTKILLAQIGCSSIIRDNNNSDACTIALDAGHSDVALLIYLHMTVNKSPVKSKRRKSKF